MDISVQVIPVAQSHWGGVGVNNFQPPGPLPILPTSNGNGTGGSGGERGF